MNEEILINTSPQETRVAIIDDDILKDLLIERTNKQSVVGDIFKAKVLKILPGIQSAFVDIGLERTGFLHITDVMNSETFEKNKKSIPINSLLQEDQEILVQAIKDPIGSKGAKLTTRITIPSRYLVYLPNQSIISVSQRIENLKERERLEQIVINYHLNFRESTPNSDINYTSADIPLTELLQNGGFIIRTLAEDASEATIHKDIEYLHELWGSIINKNKTVNPPKSLHKDLPLSIRAIRDQASIKTQKIKIDSKDNYDYAVEYIQNFMPDFRSKVELYSNNQPIMSSYSIEAEIQKSLDRKVRLKSGSYLIIDQTEAMTTIDVNTGSFVGNKTQEDTILKTNLEASEAICRQLRLRNIGGIVIIDFIDMVSDKHKMNVLESLEKHFQDDATKCSLRELTSLGLVQLIRKRTRESLEDILCDTCKVCNGTGKLKATDTVCYEIYREIINGNKHFKTGTLLIIACQNIIENLKDNEIINIMQLEELIEKKITFQIEPHYKQDEYKILPLQ